MLFQLDCEGWDNMKKLKICLPFIVFVAIAVAVHTYSMHNLEVNRNERQLEHWLDFWVNRVNDIYDGDFDRGFWFADIAGFTWDHAYIFQPGTTRSEIEAIIGFEDRNIPELIREGYTQILFVNDSHIDSDIWSVAANIHDIKPYRFYVEGLEDERYIRINFKTARARLEIQPDSIMYIIIYPNLD